MKRKIISYMLTFVCLITCCFCLTACNNNKNFDLHYNITLNLPDKIHVEYGSVGAIYIQEGNEVYASAGTVYSSDRREVFIKINLTEPVILDEPQYAQGFISARWDDYNNCWQGAEDDTNYPAWHANDHNCTVYAAAEYYLRTGYSDINMPYEMDGVTITQKANETLTVAGVQIECVVWEYVFDRETTFLAEKYWFAKDTNVFIKQSGIFEKDADINAAENIKLIATYYKTGEDMEVALANLTEPRTKYTFPAEYV